ncbi:MAG TPA: trypsin-like peptidase domain-containing protein [candidate division Zixibacteria bacterium]|nr:trypsin-like peptidase domain-containing protein [candidate division Zixibacteria bacterium]
MRRRIPAVAAALAFAAAPAFSPADDTIKVLWREAQPPAEENELDPLSRAYMRLASSARPAVVQVRVLLEPSGKSPSADSRTGSRGSGFIINAAGYILTAQHVVDRAKEIEVRLPDMQRLPARVVAADANVDLALLKIESERELPVLALGDSDEIRVGQLVVVFGYPFGRESSMSLGIVSRAGRTYPDSASYELIQTDAGAYAGGSGGPLLNSRGHVVGMITMASERGNMGFALPINVVKRVLPRLLNGEKLVWGWLGLQMTEVPLSQAKTLGLSRVKGVLVSSVLPGQAAERGGLLSRDVILAVNGLQVDSPRDVHRLIRGLEAGREVRLTVLRNGETLHLSVPLGPKPAAPANEGNAGLD